MRRLTVVFIIVALLMVGGPEAVGQTSAPSPTPPESPIDIGGRFVLPEGGYALSFPEGWDVQVHRLDFPPDFGLLPVVRAEAPLERSTPPTEVAFCEVKVAGPCDGSCSTLIDESTAREVAWWESGTEQEVPSTLASEALTLPAGYAVRVDVEYPDWNRSIYRLTDGRVAATLLCIAPRGPHDRWLSIAETFEFLPAEGPIASQTP